MNDAQMPESGKTTQPTIVIIHAMGYAGATWVNLVLGSHADAMALGPVSRILALPRDEAGQACFVHREACPLWPRFQERANPGNFFSDLADFTGKRVFVVNYGLGRVMEEELRGRAFRILHLRLVRDGRANLYSYLRHKREKSAVRAILEWQLPKWDMLDAEVAAEPDAWRLLRYEDMVLDPEGELKRIGSFLGLEYAPNAYRFWEYDHHPTAGNAGVIDTLCRLLGMPGHWHHRKESYDQVVERLRNHPDERYLDREWEQNLGRTARLAFDVFLGQRNASLGYERDTFPVEKVSRFRDALTRVEEAMLEPEVASVDHNGFWSRFWRARRKA